MTGKKIALVDVDGTLVAYEGKLPVSAVGAVRRARAKSNRVYACTGRSTPSRPSKPTADAIRAYKLWNGFKHFGLI